MKIFKKYFKKDLIICYAMRILSIVLLVNVFNNNIIAGSHGVKNGQKSIMGLSVEYTGKYTSDRHEQAKQDGKLTAGETAKLLNKNFKPETKITAAELKPFATEWHHSGFYKGGNGSTMGRTYFFSPDTNLEELFQLVITNREKMSFISAEVEEEIYYFKADFIKCGSGRHSYWQPIAEFGSCLVKPSNLISFLNGKKTQISKEDYELLKSFEKRHLESYESFYHFKERMTNAKQTS